MSSSITSNSCHYQNSHYHSHSNHNRSHHHHYKQGGSLQDLFETGLRESQLDCDQSFGGTIGGNQRTRRQNHNSRQKKYSSSVSSRQREGGSLPSNVNVTHQLTTGSGVVGHDLGFMQQQQEVSSTTGKTLKKEQNRNATKASNAGNAVGEVKDNITINTAATTVGNCGAGDSTLSTSSSENTTTASPHSAGTFAASSGDFIIDMGEPMMDIQQQQKILQSKGQDSTKVSY